MATLDTLQDSVNSLTSSTTTLVNEVQTKKATLDASVADAEAAQTGAQSARDTTLGYKNSAEAAATSATSTASALTGFNLSAIDDTITDTAVDVFVYDTSKDSDGGAWRKRTQGTSWYNETLNTSTRGNRKEFPAVAVLVLKNDRLTIYDGDDPDLPMWMVFIEASGSKDMLGRRDVLAVEMLNGLLCVVSNDAVTLGGYAPLARIDFISDVVKHTNNGGTYTFPETIGERESAIYLSLNSTDPNYWLSSEGVFPSSTLNDVAMTVLPNAPVDPATGLPVPTIAVATDGGWSQISDDGNVYDFAFNSNPKVTRISFKEYKGTTLVTWNGDSNDFSFDRGYFEHPLLTGDKTSQVVGSFDGSVSHEHNSTTSLRYPQPLRDSSDASNFSISNYMGNRRGVNMFNGLFEGRTTSLQSTGMVAHVTPTYNTGWINGDIKLATLSDTDDTDVVGSELVTNGTFDSDTSGWTANANTTLSVASGALRITAIASGATSAAYQTFTTVIGKKYTVTMETVTNTGAGGLYMRVGTGVESGNLVNVNATTAGTYLRTFTAISTTSVFTALAGSSQAAGEYKEIDNISVRLAEADRSVNDNGLQVFGTVTKNPVATGADLVSYGGFSASNYLKQPYNSDLDFGTGDFCVMGWMKFDHSTAYGALLHRSSSDNVNSVNTPISIYSGGTGITVRVKSVETTYAPRSVNIWTQYAVVRASGVLKIYVNGVEVSSTACTDDMSDSAAVSYIGGYYFNGAINGEGFNLALLRISATAPSPAQISKIYNDEKVLFQENAQATLYDTSAAVKALAYDDATELLHVGTNQGRSVFQGLRRVDNTTDAVDTAISASNGLVVEE